MPRPPLAAAAFAAFLLTASGLASAASPRPAPATRPAPPRPAPAARPAKLGQCVGCHGEFGRSRVPGTPHLGGQDAHYLADALRAYREGSRRADPMNAIANTLQPRDIEVLARWYAAQTGGLR